MSKRDDSTPPPRSQRAEQSTEVAPRRLQLATFLEDLWDGEQPSLIRLAATAGADCRIVASLRDWAIKANAPRWTREECVARSNEMVALAQDDANAQRRSIVYSVLGYEPRRNDQPIARHLFRLEPSGLLTVDDRADLGDFAGEEQIPERMSHRLFADLQNDRRWTINAAFNIISGIVNVVREENESLRVREAQAHQQLVETTREYERMRMEALQQNFNQTLALEALDGLKKAVPYLMPYLLKKKKPEAPREEPTATDGAPSETLPEPVRVAREFFGGLSPEQQVALFGRWDGTRQIVAGVLTHDQCQAFARIAENEVPPDEVPAAVRALAASITDAQQAAALERVGLEALAPLMQLFTDGASGAADKADLQ